jgi:plastocyanin
MLSVLERMRQLGMLRSGPIQTVHHRNHLILSEKGVGFDPSVIHPLAGDVVTFEFRSGDHSVVRECQVYFVFLLVIFAENSLCLETTFETPCVPLDGGFNSGIFTVRSHHP